MIYWKWHLLCYCLENCYIRCLWGFFFRFCLCGKTPTVVWTALFPAVCLSPSSSCSDFALSKQDAFVVCTSLFSCNVFIVFTGWHQSPAYVCASYQYYIQLVFKSCTLTTMNGICAWYMRCPECVKHTDTHPDVEGSAAERPRSQSQGCGYTLAVMATSLALLL